MHFFTNDARRQSDDVRQPHLDWGHPEVYILILPVLRHLLRSRLDLLGQALVRLYLDGLCDHLSSPILSFVVWLHHFFTMGSGADVNAFFGITTMIICDSRPARRSSTGCSPCIAAASASNAPMLWTLGFMITFTIGGMTGVLMAVPPADFVLHNSLFLIAHFHNVIIGGVVFGCIAGLHLLVPQGLRLQARRAARERCRSGAGSSASIWRSCRSTSLGLMGMTRRLDHFDNPVWHVDLVVAMIGAVLIICGIVSSLVADRTSAFCNREALRDLTGDPWNGRTLEWSTASPPPDYNFARTPDRHRPRRLLGHEADGHVARRRLAAYQRDPHAAQHRRGRHHRRLRRGSSASP